MKILEHLQGSGIVTAPDGSELRAKYDLQITQDGPDAKTDTPPLKAFKHITGQVWSEHGPDFLLTHFPQTMTLQMEDGRKFEFFHRDINGNIGLHKWLG